MKQFLEYGNTLCEYLPVVFLAFAVVIPLYRVFLVCLFLKSFFLWAAFTPIKSVNDFMRIYLGYVWVVLARLKRACPAIIYKN
jgi:hypothetical protein